MMRLFNHRLRPPPSSGPVERDRALEGLRGACALLVFSAHLFLPIRVLDPAWAPSGRFGWFNLGYPAVLMFFVLSGYVIGMVTSGPATSQGLRKYFCHRAARLLPLTTLAVLISWLLLGPVEPRTVLGNLGFLQNYDVYPGLGTFPVLENNPNLWSLNYEAVYYLGFVAVWLWTPPTALVFGLMVLATCAYGLGLPMPLVFARYACGALFWLGGLCVAWRCDRPAPGPQRSNWPAVVLVAYAIWIFAPLRTLAYHWELMSWLWPPPTPVSPHRLDFLPVCVWLLLAVTGRAPTGRRWLGLICLALAGIGLAGRALVADWREVDTLAALALLAGAGLVRGRFTLRFWQWLAPVGAISFGIYAIAAPLQLGQRALFPGFSGSGLTFGVRLVLVVLVVTATAWLLERRLCPPIGKWIRQFSGPKPR